MLTSFSILSNGEKMVKMDSTPKGMGCLNGMRVLTIAWIVLGHDYLIFGSYLSKFQILPLTFKRLGFFKTFLH